MNNPIINTNMEFTAEEWKMMDNQPPPKENIGQMYGLFSALKDSTGLGDSIYISQPKNPSDPNDPNTTNEVGRNVYYSSCFIFEKSEKTKGARETKGTSESESSLFNFFRSATGSPTVSSTGAIIRVDKFSSFKRMGGIDRETAEKIFKSDCPKEWFLPYGVKVVYNDEIYFFPFEPCNLFMMAIQKMVIEQKKEQEEAMKTTVKFLDYSLLANFGLIGFFFFMFVIVPTIKGMLYFIF